ncbi:MAG: hypothetical protein R6V04_02375 [bacterium]
MKSIIGSFEKLTTSVIILITFSLIVILGLIDFLTGVEFSFSIFYLLPISIVSWYAGKNAGIYASIVSAILWFLADILGGHIYSSIIILVWNSIMRFILFIIITILLSNFKIIIYKHYKAELLLQKKKNIIEAFQKLTVLISENIIQQNSEIIKWLNKKKMKGESISKKVDKASQIIGSSMNLLSETSFLHSYRDDFPIDSDMYLELLKKKLSQIKKDISLNIESRGTDDKE